MARTLCSPLLSAVLLLSRPGSLAWGDTIHWNNLNGGQFGVAANWSPAQVPDADDAAIIDLPPTQPNATYIVTLSGSRSLGSLLLGETTSVLGETLNLDPNSSLTLNGASTVTGKGFLRWAGGTIDAPNTLTNAGSFAVTNDSNPDAHLLTGTLRNTGTISQVGSGSFTLADAMLQNEAGGLYLLDIGNISASGVSSFVNAEGATFRKKSTGSISTVSVPLVNSGTIEVDHGELNLTGACTFQDGTVFNVAVGTLRLAASRHTFSGTISGTGTPIVLVTGATLAVATGTSATFDFPGSPFQWHGGTIEADGTLTNAGQFSVENPPGETDAHVLSGSLQNLGTITQTTAGPLTLTGATIENAVGAQYTFQAGTIADSGSTSAFLNAGTLSKLTANSSTLELSFDNLASGTVEVSGGPLRLTIPFTNQGTIDISVAGALELAGTLTNQNTLHFEAGDIRDTGSSASFENSGTFLKDGSDNATADILFHNLAGGTLEVSGGLLKLLKPLTNQGTIELSGGTLEPDAGLQQTAGQTHLGQTAQIVGNVDIDGGSLDGTGTVGSNLRNGGTVAPGAPIGQLTVTGSYTQTSQGTLAIEIGGPTPQQQDRLNVGGAASLDGTLAVSFLNGYQPAVGDGFTVVQSTSISGSFADITVTGLPDGEVLVGQISGNALLVRVQTPPAQLPSPGQAGELLALTLSAASALGLRRRWRRPAGRRGPEAGLVAGAPERF